MSKLTNKTYARIASLIGKLQERITHTDELVQQTKNDLATVKVQNETAHVSLVDQIDRVAFKNNKREESQTLRDQNNVQSLVNLRDSVAKAFNQVAADIKQVLSQVSGLRDRVNQVEVQNITLAKSQAMTGGSMPTDHVWVNRKLTGVYDSLTDQEQRIEKMEALIAKYETLRKAQADFARANGNFLS